MMRLSKELWRRVAFARFCAENECDPAALAEMLAHANAYAAAWERWNNAGACPYGEKQKRAAARHQRAADALAQGMGASLDWGVGRLPAAALIGWGIPHPRTEHLRPEE